MRKNEGRVMRAWVWGAMLLTLAACSTSPASPGSNADAGQSGDTGPGADTTPGGDATEAGEAGPCDNAPGGSPMTLALLPSGAHISGVSTPPPDAGTTMNGGVSAFQTLTSTVTIPAGCYASASLQFHIKTGCVGRPPPGQNWPTTCDPFDRLAHVTLADPGQTPLMLLDAVTPFGADATWTADVTDYMPVLAGSHTISAFISTYGDSSGSASGTNAGFDVDVQLTLTPGMSPRDVVGVVPLFRQAITPMTAPLAAMLAAPAGAAHARLDFFTTGHGGVGPNVCDEFCKKTNEVKVDGNDVYNMQPWVDCSSDCAHVPAGMFSCGGTSFNYICKQNPTSCPSSPVFPRANWCPSQGVRPIPILLDDAVASGSHTVGASVTNVEGSFEVGLAAVFWR